MNERFKVLSIRDEILSGRTMTTEDGKEVSIASSTRREILLQDTQKVYGDHRGVVAEFRDIEFADKVCKILNQVWVK